MCCKQATQAKASANALDACLDPRTTSFMPGGKVVFMRGCGSFPTQVGQANIGEKGGLLGKQCGCTVFEQYSQQSSDPCCPHTKQVVSHRSATCCCAVAAACTVLPCTVSTLGDAALASSSWPTVNAASNTRLSCWERTVRLIVGSCADASAGWRA